MTAPLLSLLSLLHTVLVHGLTSDCTKIFFCSPSYLDKLFNTKNGQFCDSSVSFHHSFLLSPNWLKAKIIAAAAESVGIITPQRCRLTIILCCGDGNRHGLGSLTLRIKLIYILIIHSILVAKNQKS